MFEGETGKGGGGGGGGGGGMPEAGFEDGGNDGGGGAPSGGAGTPAVGTEDGGEKRGGGGGTDGTGGGFGTDVSGRCGTAASALVELSWGLSDCCVSELMLSRLVQLPLSGRLLLTPIDFCRYKILHHRIWLGT